MNNYKLQSPLVLNGSGVYPLTTVDQVMMEDGSRLNAKYITVNLNEALEDGNVVTLNADLFDGKPSSAYALQEDLIKTVNNIEPDNNGNINLTGLTKTVNNIEPDNGGNINLTAADVNARSNTWMPDVTELASIQKGTWDGNTISPDLPLGITYAASDATGTTAGFPAGYTTILNIKYSDDRCFQIATQKFDGTTWIRSPLSNSSDGWCSWQKLLDNTDITIKTIMTDLSKTTAAPINNGEEAIAGITGILPITNGGTGADTKPQAINNLNVFPVGSIYTTSTNVNPKEWLGGTWTLIDKFLKYGKYDLSEENGNLAINVNENSASSASGWIIIDGDTMQFHISVKLAKALSDTTVELCQLVLGTHGINLANSPTPTTRYFIGSSDGGNGLCQILADGTILSSLDVVTKASGGSIASGSTIILDDIWKIEKNWRSDDYCDRFLWKRTA